MRQKNWSRGHESAGPRPRCLGWGASLSMNQHTQAENQHRQALASAARQSTKFWELRATMSMAWLWRDQGERDEARQLLAPVYGWFTEGFDTRDLKEAQALLNELSS